MPTPPQDLVRATIVPVLLALTILYVGSLRESFEQAPYFGISRLALAGLALFAAAVLVAVDKDLAWALAFAVGTLSGICNLVNRAIGFPLISSHMGPLGQTGEACQLVFGAVLALMAGWVCVGRYGATPVVAVVAYYVLTSTHLGMLTVGLRAGPLVGVTQLLIMICGLIGAPAVLLGNTGAWIFTFTLGAVNTAGHLLGNMAGSLPLPSNSGPWWHPIIAINILSGATLAVVAARWLVIQLGPLLSQQSATEPPEGRRPDNYEIE